MSDQATIQSLKTDIYLAKYTKVLLRTVGGLLNSRLAKTFCLLTLLLGAAFIRLHGLFNNGIRGSDTFQYWSIAIQWAHGHLVLNDNPLEFRQYFRPIFYALNLLSLKLFGFHDYSIKALIGIFDVLNIFLLFTAGFLLWRRFWYALILALFYAAAPSAILLSQIELAHTYSVTFVLLMFIFFVYALNKRKAQSEPLSPLILTLSGLCLGCAALVHGSVIFFGPAMVGALYLDRSIASNTTSSNILFSQFIRSALQFTLGYFIPYLVAMLFIGVLLSLQGLLTEALIRTDNGLGRFSLFSTLMTKGFQEGLSHFAMVVFWVSIALITITAFKKNFRNFRQWLPAYLVISNLFIFSMVFKDVFYPRLLLPQLPFIFMCLLTGTQIITQKLPRLMRALTVLLIAGAFLYANATVLGQKHAVLAYFHGHQVGAPKAVYNVIGNKVNQNQKLLVTPSIYYVHRRQFNAAVYFDKNAVYLYDCKNNKLTNFLSKNKIHYVFIGAPSLWDKRILKSNDFRDNHLGACFGQNISTYSPISEITALKSSLATQGAKKIWKSKKYGEIWALNN